MSALVFLLTMLAGGCVAALRFAVDTAVRGRLGSTHPWGTLLINFTGSFALGLVTGLVLRGAASPEVGTVLGTGLLGGYTTFSTASWEVLVLARAGRRTPAALHAAGMLLGGLAAAWAALSLAGA